MRAEEEADAEAEDEEDEEDEEATFVSEAHRYGEDVAPTFEDDDDDDDATRAFCRARFDVAGSDDADWAARRVWASWWWWRWRDEQQAAFTRAGAFARAPDGAGAPWIVPPLRGIAARARR